MRPLGAASSKASGNPSVVLNQARRGLLRHPAHGDHPGDRAGASQRGSHRRGDPLVRRAHAGRKRSVAPEPGRDLLSTNRPCACRWRPLQAFAPIRRIGGRTGWYFGNVLWRIRGLIDLMMGGVGMRRGRPDPETPLPGKHAWISGAWSSYEPGRRLRLFAEMKVPGRAWLEFRAEPDGASTVITADREFEPRGLVGLLYWYLLWPIHEVMFRGMLRRIAAAAVRILAALASNGSIIWSSNSVARRYSRRRASSARPQPSRIQTISRADSSMARGSSHSRRQFVPLLHQFVALGQPPGLAQ